MKFVDWRKKAEKPAVDTEEQQLSTYRGRRMGDYVEELIRQAQERGDFDNLQGIGKPLQLDSSPKDDNSMAYGLLKNNGYVPFEIELQKQIDADLERASKKVQYLISQHQRLTSRKLAPFESEKRRFNAAVEKAANEYDEALRRINSKILTLNVSTPSMLHRPILKVGELVEDFRQRCPLFDLK
ncbi:DnaJ family domain-containing protein [Dictyobacter formicarum]|uniref:DnaJ homologue subfamily C member 28 conserved domain-containing protein n=1 Tax=Dictyobacter formicarum TaxID=2778368 RepID=A0ABQ3VPK0_9CHLR|nr:DUF1992 domain-containing protein [Dictyobacter formicarum]GHO88015.1 hypothetical protein KSZ_60210 [Dictyobacter formicarum]